MKSICKVSPNILASYSTLFIALLLIVGCRTTKAPVSKSQQSQLPQSEKIQYDYTIRGTIEGKYPIKNAIIFTQDFKVVGIAPVRDNQFSFSGMYEDRDSSRFSPAYYVLCTERDTLERGDQGISRLVYLDPEVNIKFHSGRLTYQVSGGPMNTLENEFIRYSSHFKHNHDSLKKALIAHTKLSGADTASDKVNEMLTSYQFRHLAQRDSAFLVLIKSNPASMVSLDHYLRIVQFPFAANLSVASQRKLFNQLSPSLKATKLGKNVNTAIIVKEIRNTSKTIHPSKFLSVEECIILHCLISKMVG